jgi:hypothetical protein
LQAVELLGNPCRIALQEQARGLAGEGDAKDRLAHRIVQLPGQAVALARRSQRFGLGRTVLQLLVSLLKLSQQDLAFGLVSLRLRVQQFIRNQK